jgi:hypothetical protein
VGKPAVALIIAGTGETNEQEVFDLLEDAYPESDYSEIGVVVGLGKTWFTPAVQHVIEWIGDPRAVYGVVVDEEKPARAASKYTEAPIEVDKFSDLFNPEEFKDWDEVHFLVALPDDPETMEYEVAASLVEKAIDADIKVFNLSRGLDDIVLEDPEPEEKTEEPEKPEEPAEAPKRKSRARKAEEESEGPETPNTAAVDPWKDPLDDRFAYHPPTSDEVVRCHEEARKQAAALAAFVESLGTPSRERSLAVTKVEEVLFWTNAHIARNLNGAAAVPKESLDPHVEVQKAREEKPTAKDGTKRGRPRSNFEISQIFDEDAEEWIPRPKGRLTKGTEWRKIHSETYEVLEEGTA